MPRRLSRNTLLLLTVLVLITSASWGAEQASPAEGCRVTLLTNQDYYKAITSAIEQAQEEILMSFYLFKTGERSRQYPDVVLAHLLRAVKRGVPVEIILEKGAAGSSEVNDDNTQTFERLREGGVRVVFDSPRKKTHTKLIVIDGRYVFIGSHNLTQSALKSNNEASVLIESTAIADEARRYIRSLYPKQ